MRPVPLYAYLRGLPRHRPGVPPAVVVPVPVAAHAAAAASAAEPEAGNPPVVVPPAVGAGGAEMEDIRNKCIKVPKLREP